MDISEARGMISSVGVWLAEWTSVRRSARGMSTSAAAEQIERRTARVCGRSADCVRLKWVSGNGLMSRAAKLLNLNVRFLSAESWGYFYRRYGYLAKPKVYEIKRTFFFNSGGLMPECKRLSVMTDCYNGKEIERYCYLSGICC